MKILIKIKWKRTSSLKQVSHNLRFLSFLIEERVYKSVNDLTKSRPFEIEGYIEISHVNEDSFFFNSKFESGNLR